MFQIYFLDQKVQGTNIIFLNFFKNEMIKKIKIHNICDIIEISIFVEPKNYTH